MITRPARRPRLLSAVTAVSLWLVSAALIIGALALVLIGGGDAPGDYIPIPLRTIYLLSLLTVPSVGAVVAMAQPSHPIGWILCAAGITYGINAFANVYAVQALMIRPGSLPMSAVMAWLTSTWPWIIGAGLVISLFLFFPSGRLARARARQVLLLLVSASMALAVGYTFRPGPLDRPFDVVDNPFGATGLAADVMVALPRVGYPAIALAALGSIAVFLGRVRHAEGDERQQLKWLALVGVLIAFFCPVAGVTLAIVGPERSELAITGVLVLLLTAIPLAIGIATLRYRLYDIDLLINRAVVYGALSGSLAATYGVTVVLLQAILRPLTGGSELAVAGSTLLVVALFQPLRSRVQDVVDRRFYRSRYDATRTLDAFAARMRDQVDIGAIRGDMLDVVGSTLRPAHASVWLREGRP